MIPHTQDVLKTMRPPRRFEIGNYFEIFSIKFHCLKTNISYLQGGWFLGHISTYMESAEREAPLNVCNPKHCHQQSEIPE